MVTGAAMPRVSILLPARNAAETLPTCLRSLARQTEANWECILVEDASSDATAQIAGSFASDDGRIRVVPGAGKGIVAALELGLAHCHSTIVARMDADDWMHRDRLTLQLAALAADPGLAGVGCHVRLFPRAQLPEGWRGRREYERWLLSIASEADLRRDAFVECPIAHPTWMLRRSVLERHRYRVCGYPEDYDLLLRMLRANERLGVVPRRLVGWRDGPGRLSRTDATYSDEAFTACKAEHLRHGPLAQSPHYILWGYGGTGRALRRALAVHDRTPSHIVELHPRRIGQRIHGAPVIEPGDLRELRPLRGGPIVVSVAGAVPRQQIRAALAELGFDEGRDFVCAA